MWSITGLIRSDIFLNLRMRRCKAAGRECRDSFYAGRLVRWKGVQYLIDATAWLYKTRNVNASSLRAKANIVRHWSSGHRTEELPAAVELFGVYFGRRVPPY